MIIYVSGPLSNDDPSTVEQNITNAIDAGIILLSMGHTPIIPHFTQYVADRVDELKKHRFDSESKMHVQIRMMGKFNQSNRSWIDLNLFTYENLLLYDFRLIDRCDALLYLAPSKGADMEKIYALHIGKKVFMSIEEIKTANAVLPNNTEKSPMEKHKSLMDKFDKIFQEWADSSCQFLDNNRHLFEQQENK